MGRLTEAPSKQPLAPRTLLMYTVCTMNHFSHNQHPGGESLLCFMYSQQHTNEICELQLVNNISPIHSSSRISECINICLL
ncbi:hypothetical protein J6590_006086 [Homalodisca vitripennis]|nr:hypothetical protein J6590_006086 [Homalodisca vitripennis]